MAKQKHDPSRLGHTSVHKRTKSGGLTKTSSMNKSERKSHKKYRGQGR